MLTYVLVWIIGFGSLGLYLAAYLFPEVHRKNDFIWGGVGLFYALILWANAKTIPGGLLVGQIASVSLIVWLGQQTLRQRASLAPPDAQRPDPGSVSGRLRGLVIQIWKLIEPPIVLVAGFIAKVLEKPQEAEIAEIETGIAEEVKPSFLNQLTDPLSNLSGNLTGLFKSNEQSPQTISTVNVKATPAPEEGGVESQAVTEPQETQPHPTESTPDKTVEAQASSPPAVEMPPSTNPPEPVNTSNVQGEKVPESPITTEMPEVEIETNQVKISHEVSQDSEDAVPEAIRPIDPQSALPPIEIETDRPSHSSATVEEETLAAQELTASPSETEHSDAIATDSRAAKTSVESGTAKSVINSGDLQPEDKPEEWTAPDPLA